MIPGLISAGDAALVLELEPRIDPAINARAIAIANDVRRHACAGVRDVVSTYRSVAVHFDPLQADVDEIRAALMRASLTATPAAAGSHIEIPVVYGGDGGPDLADVAAFGGVSEAEVVRRHCEQRYRVFMLGFVPGFAYMGVVDPVIAAPRRGTPRFTVPAGSVGIAGSQTGVYPRATPGGWQIIGRTDVPLFDDTGEQPPLLAPGDVVTFKPVSILDSSRGARLYGAPTRTLKGKASHTGSPHGKTSRAVRVVTPGLLTTVQDLGRWGHQHEGVPVGGAMDQVSHRIANRCVGNPDVAATLEVTIAGPELLMESDVTLAIAGADLGATLNGVPVGLRTPTRATSGATLRFGTRRSGARAYIAFDGGVDAQVWLGSRATHLPSAMGGWQGRALRVGDCLPLGAHSGGAPARVPQYPRGGHHPPVVLRMLPGPQQDFFDASTLDMLTRTTFTVSTNSNRMAYPLTSSTPIVGAAGHEMISDAAFAGGLQVTPAGEAILLMADRQTTGGYPQIATVISADLSLAGQLAPGDTLLLAPCTRGEAVAALQAQEGWFGAIH